MVAAGALIMVGSLTLHTRIAERQLAIDNLESSLNASQAEFEVLRSQRAELRSPTRIALESGALGMIPGTAGDFVDVDPLLVAITIARTGELPAQGATSNGFASAVEPLDQFRAVKALGAEAP